MNELAPNPILEYNSNQMADVRRMFDYEDLNRLQQDINLFEDWIKMQHHFLVKEYDVRYLERYLIKSKGSIERAKKLLDKICTLRGLMPEYLQDFDIENEFQNVFQVFHMCVLPKPTAENNRILFYTIHNPDTALFDHMEVTRYLLMILQYLSCHDYNTGIEIVCDTKNFTFGIISKFSPIVISNTILIMIEALGLRLRGLHLITGSRVIDTMVAIIKQGMSKKVASRLHIYENYESLFKVIPKDILPNDICGDLGTAADIVEKNFKEFSSPAFIKQMKYLEGAATDESRRLSSTFNEQYSGTPGSFKVLTVD